jgi:hypothetical protein
VNFSDSNKVASVIINLKTAELRRAPNRALLDALFNGAPPYTQAEAQENKIQWNVNWGEGADLLLQGREQLENAHLSSDIAFLIRMPRAPKSKAQSWGESATKITNRLIRRSLPYFHTQRSKWGSVILHGTGSQLWEDPWSAMPSFVPISDLLIPTDTELPLQNLNHFARRRRMSPGALFRKTYGLPKEKRDPHWNMDAVKKVLDQYKDVNQSQTPFNWAEHPERMVQLWKQNTMYYETDSVPVIWMWDFYYQEDDSASPCWYRKILLDNDCSPGRNAANSETPNLYLYDNDQPYADNIGQILHIQFIDGNNVPPFMYHSTRGLGMRLHDSVQALNRLRSQFMQKVFEDMMLLFRAQDPVDRSRLDKIYLGMNYGIIPDGLTFVTRDQRYSPDPRLIEMQLSNLKQLIGEGSSQYTQQVDNGTNKERTAFEVNAILQKQTQLTGSMLNLSYIQEGFAYEEMCRRLTRKGTPEFEVKRYQNDLKEAGIPIEWIDSNRWEVEVVRVMGSGDSQLEQAQAQALLGIRPLLDPQAQVEVLHDYVFAITHDPKRASRLAPLDAQPKVTDTIHDTELAFGSLMAGGTVTPKPGLVPAEVCTTMLRLMGQMVQQIMSTDGVGTPQQVQGLQKAAQYMSAYMQQLAQDEAAKAFVKQLGDGLGQVMNLVKAMAQRQQEMQQKQQQDPEAMAKLQTQQAMTQQKLQANQQSTQQKLQSKAVADQQKLQQKEIAQQQKLAHKQQDFETAQHLKAATSLTDIHNKSMASAMQAKQAQAQAKAKAKAAKKPE